MRTSGAKPGVCTLQSIQEVTDDVFIKSISLAKLKCNEQTCPQRNATNCGIDRVWWKVTVEGVGITGTTSVITTGTADTAKSEVVHLLINHSFTSLSTEEMSSTGEQLQMFSWNITSVNTNVSGK